MTSPPTLSASVRGGSTPIKEGHLTEHPNQCNDCGSRSQSLTLYVPNIAPANRDFTTFTIFSKLPIELQDKVWRFAMPGTRLIKVDRVMMSVTDGRGWYRHQTRVNVKSVGADLCSLLHTCRGSRKETTRFYTPSLSNLTAPAINPVYLNPAADIILVSFYDGYLYTYFPSFNEAGVRQLVVDWKWIKSAYGPGSLRNYDEKRLAQHAQSDIAMGMLCRIKSLEVLWILTPNKETVMWEQYWAEMERATKFGQDYFESARTEHTKLVLGQENKFVESFWGKWDRNANEDPKLWKPATCKVITWAELKHEFKMKP